MGAPQFDPSKPFKVISEGTPPPIGANLAPPDDDDQIIKSPPPAAAPKFDPSKPFKKIEPPSQLEAAARGIAQGGSLGFEDELAGVGGVVGDKLGRLGVDKVESPNPRLQKQLDQIEDKNTPTAVDVYQQTRDSERKLNDAASDAYPKTYFSGELAGGVNPVSKVAEGLKGAAALGAGYGLGGSKADLTKGDVAHAAFDTYLGSVGGMGGYAAAKTLAPAAAEIAGKIGKKFLTTLGPSEEAINARLAGAAQDSAPSYAQLGDKMQGTLKTLSGQIKDFGDKASEKLSSEPTMPKEYVLNTIDQAKKGLEFHGQVTGEARQKAAGVLDDLRSSLNELPDQISQKDLKKVIGIVDENTNWADQSSELTNNTLKNIRHGFDETLKFQNGDYKQAMVPVAVRTRLLNNLRKQFNFQNVPGEGLNPTDATAGKIQGVLRDNKAVTQKNVGKLADFTGDDYQALSKDYNLSQQFDNTAPNGSRRTVLGGAIGGAIGHAVAPGVGTTLGTAIGAGTGATLDKYGGRVAANILDGIVKAGDSKVLGKFAPLIEAAQRKGPQALAITTSILSNNPEFKQILDQVSK